MHRGLGTGRDGDIPREIPCEQLPLGISHHSQLRVQRHQGQACWIEPFSRSSQDGTPTPASSKAFELGMPCLVLVIPASIGCRKVFFSSFCNAQWPPLAEGGQHQLWLRAVTVSLRGKIRLFIETCCFAQTTAIYS